MSRVGIKPISIPEEVKINSQNNLIIIKGKFGELNQIIDKRLEITIKNNLLIIKRLNEKKETKAYHGLIRMLLQNKILGVTNSFSKLLLAEGVGYKFQIDNQKLILSIGFSHPVILDIPSHLELKLESPTKLIISGIDKEEVGLFAAQIRNVKPPEPYKGKGIKYDNEIIKLKAGKTKK